MDTLATTLTSCTVAHRATQVYNMDAPTAKQKKTRESRDMHRGEGASENGTGVGGLRWQEKRSGRREGGGGRERRGERRGEGQGEERDVTALVLHGKPFDNHARTCALEIRPSFCLGLAASVVVEMLGRIGFGQGLERVCYTRARDSTAALSIERASQFA